MTDATEPSVFTRILRGELPGRFVTRTDTVAAFLSIAPVIPGHVLVVPVEQVDDWTELDDALRSELMSTAARIGRAVRRAYDAPRAALIIAGFEVPHAHLHVFPAWDMAGLDFGLADPNASAASLDEAQRRVTAAL
jgi:histidine triad (HIT) family protein